MTEIPALPEFESDAYLLTPEEAAADRNEPFDSILDFTACIAAALPDICSYGVVPGESYSPFIPDPDDTECDAEEGPCDQMWVRVVSIATPENAVPSFTGADCGTQREMTLEVGVVRCMEIPEGGEAPTVSETLAASHQAMEDMNAIYCAALSCDAWEQPVSAGSWTPRGSAGFLYGGIWTFTVEF